MDTDKNEVCFTTFGTELLPSRYVSLGEETHGPRNLSHSALNLRTLCNELMLNIQ